ncbi:tRNA (guanosine(46)-N7)-methyltransferase TrmB [Desulfobotulus mexicanus]|uniref:tRNA (guanine-N(7)-)-methyltransferase n=2 Tax=Desulfobotulus mexicanus TaxID=2586642 RepID=A0A5S5MC20_9BACT|nr:tRNA (guanosine(46)-N7)-methyltransferase TrmB [Desulfobotulus mexicanus]
MDRVLFPKLKSTDPIRLEPCWPKNLLNREQPVFLELGCGKGEYSLALAARYPERNFIGVDVKSDRLWVGASRAMELGLENVWFIRARIDHLAEYFPENFADGIWIPFPDPAPGNISGRKRLTSPRFLNIYRNFLKPNGLIRCKTDHAGLYDFTLENLDAAGARLCRAFEDLHSSGINDPDILGIESHFETEFRKKGYSIKFMEFYLDESIHESLCLSA